jgi:diaminohydroxyphosphoribosylaminopyrimidine deaminase/5-amino-6-(5-phosphoribosylamino)uracil reductase
MPITAKDKIYLKRTIELAERGKQTVSPNPAVGAVVVKNDTIIAEGWHKKTGDMHAEAEALSKLSVEEAEGATIYVNLEPCCHFGRTPPCTNAIIDKKIRRVVFCMIDPNPKVNGGGVEKLRENGIEVAYGFLEREARLLNEIYVHYMETGRPFIHIKAGMSLDGRIATATNKSQWITCEEARVYAHTLRQRYDGILVGSKTILIDDPRLDVRLDNGGKIHRIILDSKLSTPPSARIFKSDAGKPIIIATTPAADQKKIKSLEEQGARIIICGDEEDRVSLPCLTRQLGEMQITGMMVEGGGEVISSFVRENLVNKITFVYAPIIIGGRNAISVVGGKDIDFLNEAMHLRSIRSFRLGTDIAIEGYPLK